MSLAQIQLMVSSADLSARQQALVMEAVSELDPSGQKRVEHTFIENDTNLHILAHFLEDMADNASHLTSTYVADKIIGVLREL